MMASRHLVFVFLLTVTVGLTSDLGAVEVGEDIPSVPSGPREYPDDPFIPGETGSTASGGTAQVWVRGAYISVQVNVTALGQNIVGDAANEPSIAIDPLNPARMVIGWRQFDNVAFNFRQAGVAYSHDGGHTWVKNTLDPGQFQSDPVLMADSLGNFYYASLPSEISVEVFKSVDGGVTWLSPVPAFGGDKEWMAVDRTGGIGDGNIYLNWNVQFSCCPPNDFTRSINGGASFERALAIPQPSMKWGTSHVGPKGELYLVGTTASQTGHVVSKSSNAQDSSATPTFDFVASINLGGTSSGFVSPSPNPVGLLGQVWIATDHSTGPRRGNVYALASVNPFGLDPLDVMFTGSADGGLTWSSPVRVNDDLAGTNAWQWFGTMSVAPNGRIDVVWNDTRNDPFPGDALFISEVFYSFSLDGGVTWSGNTPVTPAFNPHLGYPNQNKIGDYYHMISDNGGASLAYAATFNGEQDVYFLRIPADCNGNGIDDLTEIGDGSADDCNDNDIPDECEEKGDGGPTLTDYVAFQRNLTGPRPIALTFCQTLIDTDHDSDIDLADFAELQRLFAGP
jgi:hypothetical protein